MRRAPFTAAEIVKALFTAGNGEVADRLVLTSATGRDLGGWGKSGAIYTIRGILDGRLTQPEPPAKGKPRLAARAAIADVESETK